MAVPTWAVGQVLAASDVNNWFVPVVVIKPGDTARNSTTTLANDPDLVIPVAANAIYDVTLLLLYTGSAAGTGDIKWTFTVPPGATGRYMPMRENLSGQFTGWATDAWTDTENANTNGTSSNLAALPRGVLVTSGSAGNLQLQWAQNTSNATNTTVRANSFLSAQRIG